MAISFAALRSAADARTVSPQLRAAAFGSDLPTRALATELIARIESDATLPLLELALGDADRGVRLHAAFGLARHPSLESAVREATLLGAYAGSSTSEERAILLSLLADTLPRADFPALAQSFTRTASAEREAACGAIGRLAQRGYIPQPVVLDRLPELLAAPEPEIATLCAAALAESNLAAALSEPVRDQVVQTLKDFAKRTDPRIDIGVSLAAVVALPVLIGRDALPILQLAAGSSETRIALEAVRQLGTLLSPAALAASASAELARQLDRPARLGGPRLQLLLIAFAAAEAHPDDPASAGLAEKAVAALHPVANEVPRVAQGRALAHCAAARLRDTVRHWPGKLTDCGHGLVPEALRDAWSAEVLALATDSDALRADHLQKLFVKGPRPVQLAAITASATLPASHAAALIKWGLAHADPVVIAAAARQVSARAADLRAQPELTMALAASFTTAERAPESSIAWLRAVRALLRPPSPVPAEAADALPQDSELTPFVDRIGRLARNHAGAVREVARSLIAEWQLADPGPPWRVLSALPEERWPTPGSVFHVKLLTTAGTLTLTLDVNRAPAAAVRFVQLARGGLLDGLPIAALTPGRVIAFAPQAETGLPALRDEPAIDPVTRGSVLLQDHGRDAVGPGFAIILERSPHLDRRTTLLGRITAGLEVADALQPADRILEAQVQISRGR